jgi:hypothetical protein
MWCPAPLPEGEQHWRKLRSDKYKPPTGRLLEFYESDSSVEANEDTSDEAGDGDVGTGPDAGGTAKSRHRTRSAVGKQSASAVATAVSAVKAAEKKRKRKRKATFPPAVVTPTIPTPRSREVESEEEEEEEEEEEDDEAVEEPPVEAIRLARRLESLAAKRHRELVEKTLEDALRRGLGAQRTAAATQAKMPVVLKPRPFRPMLRIPVSSR